jgi:hypothetical protein
VDRFVVVFVLLLIGSLAFCVAAFPRVYPRLINSYYSMIKMKTRVAEEDFNRTGVRMAGGIILIAEVVWLYIRLTRRIN